MDKFDKIYEKIKYKYETEMEVSRMDVKTDRMIVNITMLVTIALFYVIIYAIVREPMLALVYLIIVLLLGGIIFSIIYGMIILVRKPKKNKITIYYEKFKKLIIPEILSGFDLNIQYDPKSGIERDKYRRAEFERFDLYRTDDNITGIINNGKNEFEMAEVHTLNEYEDSDGHRSIQTVFHGLFMIINLQKNLNMDMKILNDKGILKGGNRLKMDSSEFEKYYDVFTNNNILTMRILTSNIMERLLSFTKETDIKFEISVKEDIMYIRFKTGAMFEPANISKYSLDKETLYRYYKILEFSFYVSEEIIKIIDDIEV